MITVLLLCQSATIRIDPGPDWVVFDARGRVISGEKGLSSSTLNRLRRQVTQTEFGGGAKLEMGAARRTGGAILRVTRAPAPGTEADQWRGLERAIPLYQRDNRVTWRTVSGRRWLETAAKTSDPKAPRTIQWTTIRAKERISVTLSWPDAKQDGLAAKGRTWLFGS